MKEEYEQRLKSVESETDSYLKSVMERRDYEVMVEGKNAKRELLNLTNKFLL